MQIAFSRPFRAVTRRVWGGPVLRRALAELPAEFVEPLTWLHERRLRSPVDEQRCRAVESLRARIAQRDGTVNVVYSPKPGSAGDDHSPDARPRPGQVMPFTYERIANQTSTGTYRGRFLYLAAKATRARSVLELGTCAGVAAAYLASAPSVERLVTIEASPDLAGLARETLAAYPNAEVVNALFDDALDDLLPGFPIDLAWIDGHHERTATLHYFERIIPSLRPGAWVMFDNITWSADMLSAWEDLRAWPGVRYALDLGGFGMLVWGPTGDPVRAFDLRPVAGSGWRPGTPHGWSQPGSATAPE